MHWMAVQHDVHEDNYVLLAEKLQIFDEFKVSSVGI